MAWESRGFVHKKEDVYILTHPHYKSIKQEILSLVELETERIKAVPALAHLIKE